MMKPKEITEEEFLELQWVCQGLSANYANKWIAPGSWSLWRLSLRICKQVYLRPLASCHHSLVVLKCMLPTCFHGTAYFFQSHGVMNV